MPVDDRSPGAARPGSSESGEGRDQIAGRLVPPAVPETHPTRRVRGIV